MDGPPVGRRRVRVRRRANERVPEPDIYDVHRHEPGRLGRREIAQRDAHVGGRGRDLFQRLGTGRGDEREGEARTFGEALEPAPERRLHGRSDR